MKKLFTVLFAIIIITGFTSAQNKNVSECGTIDFITNG